jgi:hypothetical protein
MELSGRYLRALRRVPIQYYEITKTNIFRRFLEFHTGIIGSLQWEMKMTSLLLIKIIIFILAPHCRTGPATAGWVPYLDSFSILNVDSTFLTSTFWIQHCEIYIQHSKFYIINSKFCIWWNVRRYPPEQRRFLQSVRYPSPSGYCTVTLRDVDAHWGGVPLDSVLDRWGPKIT